jgi:hypothetical protein
MNIADLLPMPPQFGPPLPRFLGITWPWVTAGGETSLQLPNLPSLFSPETSYENEELIEWVDWRGRERSVRITRKARRR